MNLKEQKITGKSLTGPMTLTRKSFKCGIKKKRQKWCWMGVWPLTASTVQHLIHTCLSLQQDTSRAQHRGCGKQVNNHKPHVQNRDLHLWVTLYRLLSKTIFDSSVTSLFHRKKRKKKQDCGFIIWKRHAQQHVPTAKRNEYFKKGSD